MIVLIDLQVILSFKQYGTTTIPASVPIDPDGKIIGICPIFLYVKKM